MRLGVGMNWGVSIGGLFLLLHLVSCLSPRRTHACDVIEVIRSDSLSLLIGDESSICFQDSIHPSIVSWVISSFFFSSDIKLKGFYLPSADSLAMTRLRNATSRSSPSKLTCGYPWVELRDTCRYLVTLGHVSDSMIVYTLQEFGDPALAVEEEGIVASDYSTRYLVLLFVRSGIVLRRYVTGPLVH